MTNSVNSAGECQAVLSAALESIVTMVDQSRTQTKRLRLIKYAAETALGRKADLDRPPAPNPSRAQSGCAASQREGQPNGQNDFEVWWQEHGQFSRAGGGDYEKTFAFNAWNAVSRPALPEGWIAVPIIPTDKMLQEARYSIDCPVTGSDDPVFTYAAMISAAPAPEGPEQ